LFLALTIVLSVVACRATSGEGTDVSLVTTSLTARNNLVAALTVTVTSEAGVAYTGAIAARDSIHVPLGTFPGRAILTFRAVDARGVEVSLRRDIAVGDGKLVWIIP
jgi:hypothetical protein